MDKNTILFFSILVECQLSDLPLNPMPMQCRAEAGKKSFSWADENIN